VIVVHAVAEIATVEAEISNSASTYKTEEDTASSFFLRF